jgi:hypothetical protein
MNPVGFAILCLRIKKEVVDKISRFAKIYLRPLCRNDFIITKMGCGVNMHFSVHFTCLKMHLTDLRIADFLKGTYTQNIIGRLPGGLTK